MKILVIDNADNEAQNFNTPLLDAVSKLARLDVLRYSNIPLDHFPITDYDGAILSGVPLEYPLEAIQIRRKYMEWIRDTLVPILGICIGHQSLGVLFGSSITQDSEAEDGEFEIEVTENDQILDGIQSRFKARLMHSCSITLPEGFKLLAKSKRCGNQIMKHRQRDIYGVQFHPELSGIGSVLLRNFVDIVKNRKGISDIAQSTIVV